MKICRWFSLFGASVLLSAPVAIATPLNTNIIVNGAAEASLGAPDFNTIAAPSGWTVTSAFSAVQYAAGGGVDLNAADSTAVGGGTNYFAGGVNNASASAMQTINVSDLAASIDSGSLSFLLSAFIGGWSTQADNMTVSARFLSAASTSLGITTIGPVTPAARANLSSLLPQSANGAVPIGTRFVEIDMLATRLEGAYNDGYADNLSLALSGPSQQVPAPAPLSLLLIGTACLWAVRKRTGIAG